MAIVGLFFGSDTGNTEAVSKMIQKKLGKKMVDVKDIAKSTKEEISDYDLLTIISWTDFLSPPCLLTLLKRSMDYEEKRKMY